MKKTTLLYSILALIILAIGYWRLGHLLGLKLAPIDLDGLLIDDMTWPQYVDKNYYSVSRKASEAMPKYIDQFSAQPNEFLRELLQKSENKNLSYLVLKEAIARAEQATAILRRP